MGIGSGGLFFLTGMLTVFIYAKLWHRSGVLTDVEFYEIRYGGKPAAFLRGFRALYLGLIFNVLVMGSVSLAAIKFGEIILGWPGWVTLSIACSITLLYSTLGGLRAIIITDFQFVLAMIGSVWACFYILNLDQIGGISSLIEHPIVQNKIALMPDFLIQIYGYLYYSFLLLYSGGRATILVQSLEEVVTLRKECFQLRMR